MKIFITGATGFIGSHLLEALLAEGHEIIALIRKNNDAQKLKEKGAKPLETDLRNIKAEMLDGIEAIFHLAAIRYEWGHLPKDYEKVNIEATKNLLEIAQILKVKKFVYGSSVFVFGYPRQLPIDETFPYTPTTNYARSKMEAEKLVKEYSARCDFPCLIIRPTITYGPGDAKGMLLKLARLIKNKKFFIIGNGRNYIHLTHIDDVVRGFQKVLRPEIKSNDFIIASEKTISQKELANLIAHELGTKIWPLDIPYWLAKFAGFANELIYNSGMKLGIKYFFKEPFISRSKIDIIARSQAYETAKARKILGFEARIDYPEGIKETISWYQKNGYLPHTTEDSKNNTKKNTRNFQEKNPNSQSVKLWCGVYKILRIIYGYFIIPVWIAFFMLTTLALIALAINAWFSRRILGKNNLPDFKPRTIFPYGDH